MSLMFRWSLTFLNLYQPTQNVYRLTYKLHKINMHPSLLFYTKAIILNCSNIVSNNGNRFKILKSNCKQGKLMLCYKVHKLMHRWIFRRIHKLMHRRIFKQIHKRMERKSNDIALEFKLKLINSYVGLVFLYKFIYMWWKSSNIVNIEVLVNFYG